MYNVIFAVLWVSGGPLAPRGATRLTSTTVSAHLLKLQEK